jgi:lipopolysaccharide/colanic/teichoic acid biosynthesis glycosyltransferase
MPTQHEIEVAHTPVFREAVSDFKTYTGGRGVVELSDPVAHSLLALSNALLVAQSGTQRRASRSDAEPSGKHAAFPCKRIVDLVGAWIILICLLPVFALCCIAVLATSSTPIFFSHRRLGRGGKEFAVWKFRSMCKDPEQALQRYLQAHPEKREEWMRTHKLTNDPRVTSVGCFMRRFSLDELPQLWNVIKGDMSLIGPRPIVRAEIDKYGDAIGAYYAVRPGMTGLWQVSGRSDTTYAERVRLDRQYAEEWSPLMDASILLSTFRVVLTGEGAY